MTSTKPSKPSSLWGTLVAIFGIIALILSLWACFLVVALGVNTSVILLNARGYRPAVFTIEKLVYLKGTVARGGIKSRPTTYMAEGKVGNTTEKFSLLGAYVKGIPKNMEELESQLSVGQELAVLYNPDVPKTQGVRVLYPKENFQEYWQQRWKKILLAAYLPLGSSLFLCILFSFLARSWAGLKFTIGSLLMPLIGWVFLIYKMS